MRLAIFILLLSSLCPAETKKETVVFYLSQTYMWAGMTFDGAVSGRSQYCVEANPWFNNSKYEGQFDRQKYFAVNIPVSAGVTGLSYLARKKKSKFWQIITNGSAVGLGTAHFRAGSGWLSTVCH